MMKDPRGYTRGRRVTVGIYATACAPMMKDPGVICRYIGIYATACGYI